MENYRSHAKMFNVGEADFCCGLSLVLHQNNGTYGSCQLALFEMYDDKGM
jgi:hypothetical protein